MTSFGFGQRACLGQTLTQDELLLACGSLLRCFTLGKKIDPKTGQEIDLPLNKSNSLLIIKPDPFEMAFTPRSVERKEEIIREWKAAEVRELEDLEVLRRAAIAVHNEKSENEKSESLVDVQEIMEVKA